MATNLLTFLRINIDHSVKSTAKFGGLATIWRGLCPPPPPPQRGTATDTTWWNINATHAMRPATADSGDCWRTVTLATEPGRCQRGTDEWWWAKSSYSIAERRVPVLIPVRGSQPAGDVSHKPGGRRPLLFVRPSVIIANLKRAATDFAAWSTEARWVWTVCLGLLPDSVAAAI